VDSIVTSKKHDISHHILSICVLYSTLPTHEHVPEQYPPPPRVHPQQLSAPYFALLSARVKILTTPSPSTNPLATTIANRGVSPVLLLLFAARYAIHPPISLAMENDGELRIPIANAIPDGRWRTMTDSPTDEGRYLLKDLIPEVQAKIRPKKIIKGTTCDGRWPLFNNRARPSLRRQRCPVPLYPPDVRK
jgi:hypothetical protein